MSTLLLTAFIFSLFRAHCYKTRQQRPLYDIDVFSKFVVFLSSNVANALFLYATFISIFVLIMIRSQTVVKMLLPIEDQGIIEIFIYVAVALKVKFYWVQINTNGSFIFKTITIIHMIWQQSHVDIFLIDWERPKVFDHHPRNHLDTPSISSSVRSYLHCVC